ncbi:MAG TPA: UDP-N-acetylmuramoyl-L-alanine--D-glutamate ligase [Thermomicrobiales bacterium]|nr:UDP-N-acetylmuramoyl-L-alanine--D-glutamate ligase [Thermomicrobiales bacterium]
MTERIAGTRYTVMGLGVLGGGVGVAQYLARHGGIVIVTDMNDAEKLAESIGQLAGLPIDFHLGGHEEADFTRENADVIVRNPGVRRTNPYLALARESGVRVEMEMSLFFRACRAPILGVTGTKGKTSVSTLCANILRAWNSSTILAGNMGISALNLVDDIAPEQPVVLELSSWQLEALDEHRLGPRVGVITNVSPDHLDSYDSFAHYAATKRTIAHHGGPEAITVYNADDPECIKVVDERHGRLLPFGLVDEGAEGAWLCGDALVLRWNGAEHRFALPTQLQLRGDHGLRNALAAIAATAAYGAPAEAIRAGLESFSGVPNRMEEIATIRGVLYINDTAASAPAAAVAGLNVLGARANRLHLIAGGADKKTDLTPFADAIAGHRPHVVLLDGSATPALIQLLKARDVAYEGPFDNMAEAFATATADLADGDIVTLTPGCASFGIFRNEFDRGDQFRSAVLARQAAAMKNAGEKS